MIHQPQVYTIITWLALLPMQCVICLFLSGPSDRGVEALHHAPYRALASKLGIRSRFDCEADLFPRFARGPVRNSGTVLHEEETSASSIRGLWRREDSFGESFTCFDLRYFEAII